MSAVSLPRPAAGPSDADLAARMILRWFPTPIIRLHTGLSDDAIRELYRQLHDAPPPPPMFPEVTDLLGTTASTRQASIFLSHYIRLAEATAYRRVDVNALIVSHDLHFASRDPHVNESTSITAAWVLARELRSRTISFHACPCGRDHVVHDEVPSPTSCPHCGKSLARDCSPVHEHTWRDGSVVDTALCVS